MRTEEQVEEVEEVRVEVRSNLSIFCQPVLEQLVLPVICGYSCLGHF